MPYEIPLNRIDAMAEVSADAFSGADDPIGHFIFQNEPGHLELKRRFFRSLVTACSPRAVRQASSEKLEAVSIWFPPGMDHSEDKEPDPLSEKDFKNRGTMARLEAVNHVIGTLTLHLGDEPQWYLHLIAVPPPFHGQGHASRLLRPMMERAAKEGLPCTLITQSLLNVRKYEHWGFEVTREMAVPGSREKFYAMRKNVNHSLS
jgi:GNAT superfamily N-acetyltransferase